VASRGLPNVRVAPGLRGLERFGATPGSHRPSLAPVVLQTALVDELRKHALVLVYWDGGADTSDLVDVCGAPKKGANGQPIANRLDPQGLLALDDAQTTEVAVGATHAYIPGRRRHALTKHGTPERSTNPGEQQGAG
jgi:hypothetical protein